MNIDPWILSFSAVTVIVTIWMGFRSAKTSKTASDFFVAGRSVGVGMNASAISGEYLSAASFMGVAGMVMSSGYDALWYPVCYACGYLFLLLFIAGPLRRFGAYTIPDFAEGRFDSPLFRKIAVIFVLFIGFFYTMPQMKGAGTTLAYIFDKVDLRGVMPDFMLAHDKAGIALIGLPYWVGVALVGAVITLNVALGGMKGITLVQAIQYWIKMFAISVPIFVLMSVYGNYGKQLDATGKSNSIGITVTREGMGETEPWISKTGPGALHLDPASIASPMFLEGDQISFVHAVEEYNYITGKEMTYIGWMTNLTLKLDLPAKLTVAEYTAGLEKAFAAADLKIMFPTATNLYVVPASRAESLVKMMHIVERKPLPEKAPADQKWISPFGPLTTKAAAKAGLNAEEQKPFSLLYTYSLIIALVCGTAGLPHILVRFYTNPDGVAAKRTTMWVMILIGVFYVFPPVFGVMGRNLLPELYNGTGAKGTDKVVLELPRILNDPGSARASRAVVGALADGSADSIANTSNISTRSDVADEASTTAPEAGALPKKRIPWGSILSGITCAGAFAAFMSTFSGLLVSMTGALAHDVYGRILRPKSTPEQRMRAFKICAVLIGGIAIVLGSFVEPLEINFMVGQAFAIAAASYFPLLFMSVWWRGMTAWGAATGMLTGGICALIAAALTNFSTLASDKGPMGKIFSGFAPMNDFWAHHPLLRILCDQPAIWTVPLAITLMIVVSKLTRKGIPTDVRMKMLVLHAPEKLGLKQEYIQEQQVGH